MKNYHKTGNRPGKPAYRTASLFRAKQFVKIAKNKIRRKRRVDS